MSTVRLDNSTTIFVAICAYRDPELKATLIDCINCANHPERLFFGVCNQFDPDTHIETSEFSNMRMTSVPYPAAKGLGWARERVRRLYDNQDLVMQLDSHMRFKPGWDDYHIGVLHSARQDGIQRPLVTAACPTWVTEEPDFLTNRGTKIGFKRFFERGTIEYQPEWMNTEEQEQVYIKGVFVSAHYMVTLGTFYDEFSYDPEIYFGGEEASLTVRSFTMGYDVIHPSDSYVYHNYDRNYRSLHWLDHTHDIGGRPGSLSAPDRDTISTRRIRQLLEIQDYGIDLSVYGLGTRRSLDDWINRSGIDIRRGQILEAESD